MNAQQPWLSPPQPVQRPVSDPPRQQRFSWLALVAAVVAVAALFVGAIGLTRSRPTSLPTAPVSTSSAAPTQTISADAASADKALCTTIAPLMTNYDRTTSDWRASGDPGMPTRDAALPKYRSDTEDWARQSQAALDAIPNASAFLKRTLQRYIDDQILLVRNMKPGPLTPYDDQAYEDGTTAYEGPISACGKVGVTW